MTDDVLIFATTLHSPELRHEIPLPIPDPFLYAEHGGARHVLTNSMEAPLFESVDGVEVHLWEEFGWEELRGRGLTREAVQDELRRRAVRAFGVERAVVPDSFPVRLADVLRASGVELRPDGGFFAERRRVKTDAQLAGIRRAQAAAEAAVAVARDLLRRASERRGELHLDGAPLTCELVKAAMVEALHSHDATAGELIVSHGAQTAVPHDMGSGVIRPSEPVIVDLAPRDRTSGCHADMTRTFVVGDVPRQIADWHAGVQEALERALAAVAAGAGTAAVYGVACDAIERRGQPTGRTRTPGRPLAEGFFHDLGHGVGLEVHEQPFLGQHGQDVLRAGDVVTVEPGLYRPGYGGVRLEDLVHVTADGCENLTRFAYDLTP